jgi:dolichol-phosphate mannosyltransferase
MLEMDCDFSHHPRCLPALLEHIQYADLVIGSRYVSGGGAANWASCANWSAPVATSSPR